MQKINPIVSCKNFFLAHKTQIILNIVNWAVIATIGYLIGYFSSFSQLYQAPKLPQRYVYP